MAGKELAVVAEDEAPRQGGGQADYLGIHKVAQAYEGCRKGRDETHVVEDVEKGHAGATTEEPKREKETDDAAVTCQTFVADEPPTAAYPADGQKHLHRVGQVVRGLVEEAMAQARAYEHAYEAIDEHQVELVLRHTLKTEKAAHVEITQQERRYPTEGIPTDGIAKEEKGRGIGRPVDEEEGE